VGPPDVAAEGRQLTIGVVRVPELICRLVNVRRLAPPGEWRSVTMAPHHLSGQEFHICSWNYALEQLSLDLQVFSKTSNVLMQLSYHQVGAVARENMGDWKRRNVSIFLWIT
jgi:hypothetical protein